MLNPKADTSEGWAKLARISLREPSEEGKGPDVDVDLVVEIVEEEDAQIADTLVPGALAIWSGSKNAQKAGEVGTALEGAAAGAQAASGTDGFFGTYSRPVHDSDLSVELGDGDVVVKALHPEVLTFRVRSTPKTCVFVTRIRLSGLAKDEIATVVGWFAQEVQATTKRLQPALPFKRGAYSPGVVGEIASGKHNGREWAGLIVGRSTSEDGEMVEIDDCGSVFVVPAATISGSFALAEQGRDELVGAFQRKAKKAKVDASWLSLVVALGTAYMASDTRPWALTEEIVEDAVREAVETASQGAAVAH